MTESSGGIQAAPGARVKIGDVFIVNSSASGGREEVEEPPKAGRLIKESNPADLGVHPAIELDPGPSASALPVPPEYVARSHDHDIHRVVDTLAETAMVVLVGGSSTGKTRALWEAVQSLPAGWRIWQPIGLDPPETLLRALAGDQIAPRTVLWLDDLHDFLAPPSSDTGRKIAAGLRDMVSNPGHGPVLILGTLWPEDWHALTADPVHDRPDPHSRARALLALAATIRVPEEFSAEDLGNLADASSRDPRLALADAQAGAKVTQFLAGIPELMRRYDMADSSARAVITAAIDAHRVVGITRIPEAFLRDAAPGYMNDDTWNQLNDRTWFGEALKYAVRRSLGVPGPLERIRSRPGEDPPAQPQYRPHDYLAERDRQERRFAVPPRSFWDSAARHVHSPSDLLLLAREARHRHYYRIADALIRRAAATGDRIAKLRMAELLTAQGHLEEAISLRQQALENATADESNDIWQAVTLASQLEQVGHREEATPWWRRAVDAVDRNGMSDLGPALRNAGRLQEAELWLSSAATNGDSRAAGALVTLLERLGRYHDAIRWARRLVEMGDHDASWSLFWLLRETGQLDEAANLLEEPGPDAADKMTQLVGPLERAGRTADARQWLYRAAVLGDREAISRLNSPLEREGRFEEAAELWKASAEAGNWRAVRKRSELLKKAGKLDKAAAAWLSLAQSGNISAMLATGELLVRAGKLDQAISWLTRAAELGSPTARPELRRLLDQADHDAALAEWESAVLSGEPGAGSELAELLERSGNTAEAREWLRTAAGKGDSKAMLDLSTRMAKEGNPHEADEWLRRAADAGNRDAVQQLASSLAEDGRLEEAARVWLSAAEHGSYRELYPGIQMLKKAGKIDEAEARLRYAFETGRRGAQDRLIALLEETGRTHEAQRLAEYGIEPGGATAEAW